MKIDFLKNIAIQEKVTGLTRVQKILVFVGTLVVLVAAFYFLLYKDQGERIKKLKATISDQEKKLVTLKQAAARAPVLEKELAEAQEEFERLLAFLPDQKEIPALLENVSKVGAEVGLENILFQPQAEQVREFYAVIPVRLDLRGTYHELGVFFDRVSKLNRILKVEALNMVRQKDTQDLQVGCTIVTYRFVEEGQGKKETPGKGAPPKK